MIKLVAKFLVVLLLLVGVNYGLSAQTSGVKLAARVENKRIILRWMPLDPLTWAIGNKQGWVLQRTNTRTGQKEQHMLQLDVKALSAVASTDENAQVLVNIFQQQALEDTETADIALGMGMLASSTNQVYAKALGQLFIDETISNQESYEYRISTADGKIEDRIHVDASKYITLLRPVDVTAALQDSMAVIRWQSGDSLLHMAYRLERSKDQKKWKQVNPFPIISTSQPDSLGREYISFEDRLPTFYEPYYYRVRAITPFGILSNPSWTVKVEGYRQKFSMNDPTFLATTRGVAYSWEFPKELEPEIKGFSVYTSTQVDSNYVLVGKVSPTSRSFHDTLGVNDTYLRVGIINWVGQEQFTQPVLISYNDSIPPANPQNIQVAVAKTGVVTFRWNKNAERDFKGYSVFRADNPKSEFSLLSKKLLPDTTFTDTLALNLLNKKVYYVVRSFDTRMNGSIPTDTLVVKRPDSIPPAAAAISGFEISEKGIELAWINSPSDDLAKVQLLRRATSDSVACILHEFKGVLPSSSQTYTDTTVIEKLEYTYSLVAIDEAELAAEPAQIKLAKLYTGIRDALTPLQFDPDPYAKTVVIRWPIPTRKVKKYILYRQGPQDTFLGAYHYFEGKYGSFTDTRLQLDALYRYQLQAIYEDDSESSLKEVSEFTLTN